MVKRNDKGELIVGLLDDRKVLSKEIIDRYNYKDIKENFDYLVELLEMNKMFHSMYRETLEYEITDELEFKIFCNSQNISCTIDMRTDYLSTNDTSVITLDKNHYEQYVELCHQLLIKIRKSWKQLNEVERFIIKALEFDNPSSTDEELQDELMYCNKKYYQYKKSGFIKLGTQLQIDRAPKKVKPLVITNNRLNIDSSSIN